MNGNWRQRTVITAVSVKRLQMLRLIHWLNSKMPVVPWRRGYRIRAKHIPRS